jgi:hypothetical protein
MRTDNEVERSAVKIALYSNSGKIQIKEEEGCIEYPSTLSRIILKWLLL